MMADRKYPATQRRLEQSLNKSGLSGPRWQYENLPPELKEQLILEASKHFPPFTAKGALGRGLTARGRLGSIPRLLAIATLVSGLGGPILEYKITQKLNEASIAWQRAYSFAVEQGRGEFERACGELGLYIDLAIKLGFNPPQSLLERCQTVAESENPITFQLQENGTITPQVKPYSLWNGFKNSLKNKYLQLMWAGAVLLAFCVGYKGEGDAARKRQGEQDIWVTGAVASQYDYARQKGLLETALNKGAKE